MGWMIYDNNEAPLCNFSPHVVARTDAYTSMDAAPIPHLTIQLNFGSDQFGEEFTLPLSELEETRWLDKDIRCRFHPEAPPGKARRYLADKVRSALPSVPIEKMLFVNRVGTYKINGKTIFCTGGGLIMPPGAEDGPAIKLGQIPYDLDIDTNLSEAEAVAGMLELVSLAPNPGRIILAHKLMSIMRQVYEESWKSPCTCVFLYGKTGIQKTTVATLLTQMYNCSQGVANPVRLNASIAAAVGLLKEVRDDIVILDDLFPANSGQIRGQQEETLLEVTRFIGDGTLPARMRGARVEICPPTCGVLFTGEYLLGSGSDAARLLPVEMTPPDGEKLKYFQDNPLIVSSFYKFFIQWFIENYTDISGLLQEWLTVYRQMSLGVHDRLQETHYFFNTAYSLLLQYCYDKGFISQQDAERLHRSFLDLLTGLVQAQDKRVNQKKSIEPDAVDHLARIRMLYKGEQFVIADRAELYLEGVHDGVLHYNCLCLRGYKLSEYFPAVSLTEISDSLLVQGALRTTKNNCTIQISCLRGKRFYAIPLARLN